MEQVKVGNLIGYASKRDAIHVAICPMVAAERLLPGQRVGIIAGRDCIPTVYCGATAATVGIVDPFLIEPVEKGQMCYLFLYPNTVTSLRHDWTHLQFQGTSGKYP